MSLARRLSGLLRVVAPVALLASLVGTAAPANAIVTYPYVQITSPGSTSSSAGTTAIQFSAAVDPNGIDSIQNFGLVVDGTEYGGAVYCPTSGSKACSAQLLWNATAPDGSTAVHSVQVEMYTTQSAKILSAPVSVTATHPTATPVISAPGEGAPVPAADVFVDADLSFAAPTYGETAYSFSLYVDGTRVDYELCDPSTAATSCPIEFYWDASAANPGSHALEVRLVTASGATWDSPDLHVTVVVPPTPVVTITSPAANASVSGAVNVTATGSVDATYGDKPLAMALFVDDRLVGVAKDCPATGATCTLSFPWDASGLTGRHTVKVGFATAQAVVFSGPMSVIVTSPAPTVTLTLTGDPTTLVRGVTQVTLIGTIDASQTDTARDLQLYVNGEPLGAAQQCTAAADTCTATFSWNTASLAGARAISVSGRFDTAHAIAWTPVRFVSVGLDQSAPGNSHVGVMGTTVNGVHYAEVRVWDKNLFPLIGVPVTVTVKPGTGPSYTLTGTTTGPYGETLLPLRSHVTSLLTASLDSTYGSVTSSRKFIVQAVATCRLPSTVTHGRKTIVVCKGSRVAAGTKVTLYFKYPHAGVHVLGHARFDAKGHATIVFVSKVRKETVQLWAQVSNSAVYGGTQTRPVLVRMI
ncbi:MAG: hypothetical protein QOI76_15 [Frankiales bacterium]|nr:hypothetical protein [Frankiales bacterium]